MSASDMPSWSCIVTAVRKIFSALGTAMFAEVVTDKGYHSNDALLGWQERGMRTQVSEPDRGRRKWKGKADAQRAVYANRRRVRSPRGRQLQRARGEKLERSNAHLYETGGMRRTYLRGHANILKRLIVHAAGFNLGLLMRAIFGIGKPRTLQDAGRRVLAALRTCLHPQWTLLTTLLALVIACASHKQPPPPRRPIVAIA